MSKILILILIILTLLSISGIQHSEASDGKTPPITKLIIHFDKENALFTVDYNLDTIPKIYVLLLGGGFIDDKMKYMFSNFNYNVIKINQEETLLNIKNISRYNYNGYYLHDKTQFNVTIPLVIVYTPDSKSPIEYHNINSTPNIFYKENP